MGTKMCVLRTTQLHLYSPWDEVTFLWGYLSQEYMNYLLLELAPGALRNAWLKRDKPSYSCLFFLGASDRKYKQEASLIAKLHSLASWPVLLHLPWLHGTLWQRRGCTHTSPTSAKGQNISSIPDWMCWLSTEQHTHSVWLSLLGFGLNSCYRGRFHKPAAVKQVPPSVLDTHVSAVTAGLPLLDWVVEVSRVQSPGMAYESNYYQKDLFVFVLLLLIIMITSDIFCHLDLPWYC